MESLFELFDAPIIRSAKNREVKIDKVKERSVWLIIDDEIVKIEKTSKGILYSCSCDWCGAKGIPNKVFNCGRIMKAQDFLWKRNGRISEIEEVIKK